MPEKTTYPLTSVKSRVALVKCESYDPTVVMSAVRRGVDLLGGIEKFAQNGEKIVLKPNLLRPRDPAENVTTHPSVVRAVAEILLEKGVAVSIGDSSPRGHHAKIFQVSGMQKITEELGLAIADFENGRQVSSPNSLRNKQFTIAEGIFQANGLFNIPKLKTHHLTRITAAQKNLYGCIPGILKPALHVALPAVDDFSRMLVDLNILLKPRLIILDAVEAMHGNGPSSGDCYPMKLLAFSTDPVAIDSVVCRLIHLNPEYVRTNYWGAELGLGKMNSEDIELLGDDPAAFDALDFKVQRQPELRFNQAWRYRKLKHLITIRPIIDADKCKKCGECVDQCPQTPKALAWPNNKNDKPPIFDYSKCIRCFCCQEVCPHKAIDAYVPFLRRVVDIGYSIIYKA